jgi:hypothetical protein
VVITLANSFGNISIEDLLILRDYAIILSKDLHVLHPDEHLGAFLQFEVAIALLRQLNMHRRSTQRRELDFDHWPSSVEMGNGGPEVWLSGRLMIDL